jgi:hypothetical protein
VEDFPPFMKNRKNLTILNKGDEIFIPKGTPHSGDCIAGTRSIHAFGGKRAKRISS